MAATVGLILVCSGLLLGQDTTIVHDEQVDSIKLNNFYHVTFVLDSVGAKERFGWLKIDLIDLYPRFVTPVNELPFSMSITFEHSLKKGLSINGFVGLNKDRYIFSDPNNSDYVPLAIYWGVEPRCYYQKSSDLLKGRYFGVRLQGDYRSSSWYNYNIQDPLDSYITGISLLHGHQHSVGNTGFFNLSYGGKVFFGNKPFPFEGDNGEITHRSMDFWGVTPYYKMDLGFAFLFQKNQKEESLRGVIRTDLKEKALFKVNMLDLFRFVEFSPMLDKISGKLDIGFEFKPFMALSINTYLAYQPLWYRNKSANGRSGSLHTIDIEIAPRWYFTQKRRILRAKSGNNLSGDYITSGFRYRFQGGDLDGLGMAVGVNERHAPSVFAAYGIQRRIFKQGFFDINLGFGKRLYDSIHEDFFLLSEIKVGFAF